MCGEDLSCPSYKITELEELIQQRPGDGCIQLPASLASPYLRLFPLTLSCFPSAPVPSWAHT